MEDLSFFEKRDAKIKGVNFKWKTYKKFKLKNFKNITIHI